LTPPPPRVWLDDGLDGLVADAAAAADDERPLGGSAPRRSAPPGGDEQEPPLVAFAWDGAAPPGADVVWSASGGQAAPGARVIAPAGSGLWRRAPWPAADSLFELDAAGEAIVVCGPLRTRVAALLGERDLPVEAVGRLTAAACRGASVVVATGDGDAMPAEAPAVLAAGRVLVTGRVTHAFGFRGGIDHCIGTSAEDLADLAESALRHWDAFHGMRVHGRVAAERHRASRVLRALAFDLTVDAAGVGST
jgi:hypothetical protein